ncbi:sugar nucleotide-binding protein [Luminiphilus sp.]|nr:sugar nucleotide-binding protein [Luminiphilus sp.]MDB2688209.1 sugar nucleotide-binding protein [Luminiphilus sp.]MDC0572264.1 sugar nucleotide-binding protein [Luminiphilus sp.]MDC6472328.1 sugar nucleotide-binding protein [Luminiphilus sp.]
MRILVLGLDAPLGFSLRAFAAPLMRHEIIGVDMDATRWRRERQVKKLVRRQSVDLILDARLVTQIDGVDPVGQRDVERTQWLAGLAARDQIAYFFLSSARVFSGTLTRPYRETDQPDATDPVGRTLIEVEQLLSGALDEIFILRLGLMFGGRRPNPLARALDALARGDRLKVSEHARGSPVHVAEVARVIHGIIDQIGAGAPRKGLYHYSGIGEVNAYSFMETVLANASQYEPFKDARELMELTSDGASTGSSLSLDCAEIRHQFGIQQLSWREFVPRAVQRYIELYSEG